MVFVFQLRPWVAVLNLETDKVMTVYPTDQRTVDARRGRGGRLHDGIHWSHLLCLDITDPRSLGKLLAKPIKAQLPVGL